MSLTPSPGGRPPSTSERDADGRLVNLCFDSHRSPWPSPTESWLIAIDGSTPSHQAAAVAARMANEMQACSLHLINVQQWFSKEAAESELAQRGWDATTEARALLDEKGLPWRLHIMMGDAAERIIALAASLRSTCIVIGSRGLGITENLVFGSVAYKVLHTSQRPVLVVR